MSDWTDSDEPMEDTAAASAASLLEVSARYETLGASGRPRRARWYDFNKYLTTNNKRHLYTQTNTVNYLNILKNLKENKISWHVLHENLQYLQELWPLPLSATN